MGENGYGNWNGNGNGTVKVDVLKTIGGMLLAGLVSYFATTYGLQERISVMEVKLGFVQNALNELKGEVQALRHGRPVTP